MVLVIRVAASESVRAMARRSVPWEGVRRVPGDMGVGIWTHP